MSKQNKKTGIKERLIKIFSFIMTFGIGGITGVMVVRKSALNQGGILELFFILAIIIISFMIQIILHEAGHLICGLLSGYEFVSFRVGSLTLIKEDGKFAIKKFNIKGTAGQCLMSPKYDDYEKCSYVLYNLGGILMNAILTILSFAIYMLADVNVYLNAILISMIGSGIVAFVTNGIPMKIGGIANDGYNVFSMRKDKLMRYCFYTQLRVNGLMSKGMRVKDMPLKWFEIDENSDFSNPLVTSIKCIEASYYHDKLDFDKARECYEFLLSYNPKVVELYKYEIKCELLFYEIIGKRDEDKIRKLYTKKLKSYIKASKSHISKMRLMYAYALIIEKDMEKVKKILDKIERVKRSYPNKGEIEGEIEIIEFVRSNFENSTI